MLNLIEHLPRGSAFAEAVAQDDDLVDEEKVRLAGKRRPPPVSEFTPDVELQAAIFDRLGALIAAVIGVNGGKPPKLQPWPRPVTATERARDRAAFSDYQDIVAKALPRNGEARQDP